MRLLVAKHETSGVATFSDRAWLEELYLDFAGRLLDSVDGAVWRVAEPTVDIPLPRWLPEFRNGTELDRRAAGRILRGALRGTPLTATLEVPRAFLRVRVGSDHRLVVEVPESSRELVDRSVPDGLRVVGQDEPDAGDYCKEAADDAFWSMLKDASRAAHQPLWILEQWAYGRWGERWYLASAEDVDTVRGLAYPHSMIRAGFAMDRSQRAGGATYEAVVPGADGSPLSPGHG